MSEAAIVLWVIGFVVFTFNIAIICECAEKIARMKYKEPCDKYQSDWISIEDMLPDESGDYITCFKDGDIYINYFNTGRNEFNFYHSDVEMWAFLPKRA